MRDGSLRLSLAPGLPWYGLSSSPLYSARVIMSICLLTGISSSCRVATALVVNGAGGIVNVLMSTHLVELLQAINGHGVVVIQDVYQTSLLDSRHRPCRAVLVVRLYSLA